MLSVASAYIRPALRIVFCGVTVILIVADFEPTALLARTVRSSPRLRLHRRRFDRSSNAVSSTRCMRGVRGATRLSESSVVQRAVRGRDGVEQAINRSDLTRSACMHIRHSIGLRSSSFRTIGEVGVLG